MKSLKFGKIDRKNLEMEIYPLDSTANAVVLADQGFSEVRYTQEQGYFLYHTHHKRIKILSEEGFDYANLSIPIYQDGGIKEQLSNVKAATYNLVKGKVKATKLGKKSRYSEKLNKYYTNEKFTFPEVKKGSIIEYSYVIKSDFISNLQDWSFQSDVPTVWSEYVVMIPDRFDFERFAQGYHQMTINTTEKKTDRRFYSSKNRQGGDGSAPTTKTNL